MGLLAICATALAWAPTAAIAEPAPVSQEAVFFVEASNGYAVTVLTFADWVVVEARRKRVSAMYAVRGDVSAERVEARFGDLGRISVGFDPLGGKERRAGRCRRSPLDLGIFRGRIEFKGEGGYTVVNESRTVGLVFQPRPRSCRRRSAARSSAQAGGPLDTHIAAISRRKGAVTAFELSRKRGRPWLDLTATREERSEGMWILRRASTLVGGANAFAVSGPGVLPQFAFIAAPKPFNGSAVLDAAAEPGLHWSGDLSAWMPGAKWVPLAGPDFAISFCRRAADEPGCGREPPGQIPFLRGAQGSGSQSQAFGEARLSWSRYLRNSASSAGSTP